MELQDFLSIGIVGVLVSLLVEVAKEKVWLTALGTKLVVVAVSVVVGLAYWLLRDTAWYQSIAGVLSAATVAHAFFIRKSE